MRSFVRRRCDSKVLDPGTPRSLRASQLSSRNWRNTSACRASSRPRLPSTRRPRRDLLVHLLPPACPLRATIPPFRACRRGYITKHPSLGDWLEPRLRLPRSWKTCWSRLERSSSLRDRVDRFEFGLATTAVDQAPQATTTTTTTTTTMTSAHWRCCAEPLRVRVFPIGDSSTATSSARSKFHCRSGCRPSSRQRQPQRQVGRAPPPPGDPSRTRDHPRRRDPGEGWSLPSRATKSLRPDL